MKKIVMGILALSLFSFAQTFTQTNKATVTWTAFKTLGKIGVSGDFTDIKYNAGKQESDTLASTMIGSKIIIDSTKIDTKNPARDTTISEMFFKKLPKQTINGEVISLDEAKSTMKIRLSMGGITKDIPMKYELNNNIFKATGAIDILDFGGFKALRSINKSCYDLHEGKTWNDVNILFTTNLITK